MSLCVVCACECNASRSQKRTSDLPGGVPGGCYLPGMGPGNLIWVLCKSSAGSESILQSQHLFKDVSQHRM